MYRVMSIVLMMVVAVALSAGPAWAKGGKGGKGHKGPKPVIGTIKALDKDKATMTVTVKGKKKQTVDKDFTLPDSATATVMGVDGRTKDMPIKDALKYPAMAIGGAIKVTTGFDGAVTRVEVGGIYAQPNKKKKR
jgi:hypothetical protein